MAGERIEEIVENGVSFVSLSTAQAAKLQQLAFCHVSPTADGGLWRISNVSRVGVVAIDDLRIVVRPKTPLRSLIFMASYAGTQATISPAAFDQDVDRSLPAALASALVLSIANATSGGLHKGYVPAEEAGTVIRGRWDIARQIKTRPGLLLPAEISFDDFTEDTLENRILKAALRALLRLGQLSGRVVSRIAATFAMFTDVSDLRVRGEVPMPAITRMNAHYRGALDLARWILEATSWARTAGDSTGSVFLLDIAKVYEQFVGRVLRGVLGEAGCDVDLQASGWRLDEAGQIRMRPDIVVSRQGLVITVADTKYKNWGNDKSSPPNSDVYQALAYAITAGVQEVHLLYVSGDVTPRRYEIGSTGTTIIAHAVDLSGDPDALLANVRGLGAALLASQFGDCA